MNFPGRVRKEMNTMKYQEGSKFGKMNGRMYDPVVSRFISPDPFIQSPSQSESFNRYSYCMNNPMRFTDPSGYVSDGQEARDRALRMQLKAAQERLDAEHAYYYSSALNANLDYGGYLHGYGSNGNFTAIYTNSSGALLGMGVSQGSAFDENYTLSSQGIEYMNSLGFNGFVRGSNGDYWAAYNTVSAGKWTGSMETGFDTNDKIVVSYVNLTAMMGNGNGNVINFNDNKLYVSLASMNDIINEGSEQAWKNSVDVVQIGSDEAKAQKLFSGIVRTTKYIGWAGDIVDVGVSGINAIEHWNSSDAGYYQAKAVGSGIIVGLNALNFVVPGLGTVLSLTAGAIDSAGGFDFIYDEFK